MAKQTFLLSIMNGWAIRNLEGSSLLNYLNAPESGRLTVATVESLESQVTELFPAAEIVVIPQERFHHIRRHLSRNLYHRLAKGIHVHRFLNRTTTWAAKAKLNGDSEAGRAERLFSITGLRTLSERYVFPWAARNFAEWVAEEISELKDRRFDVGLTLCVNAITEDFLMSNYISRRCSRSIGYMLSWDNLSSKIYWVPPLDELMIWGREMRNDVELISGDYFPDHRVKTVGALQFDWHFSEPMITTERAKKHPFIFYACVTVSQFEDEAWFLEECVRAVGEQYPEVRWHIRVHPKEDGGRFAALAHYEQVVLDVPNQGDIRNWSVDRHEKENLRRAIKDAFLICTSFGTMALEALIYGKKPVLITSPNQDGSMTLSTNHLNYHHTRVLMEKTNYTQVDSPSAMIEAVGKALDHEPEDYRHVYNDFFVNNGERSASDAIVDLLEDNEAV